MPTVVTKEASVTAAIGEIGKTVDSNTFKSFATAQWHYFRK
jgi:hypothetical protein